ncbi:MAG: pyridoxamine 5'-phosphate oxidase [Acidobacteria bacterium]|nr:pyridoxamine 5'-phosphate oxidase [Acidobacteriota bacterium]
MAIDYRTDYRGPGLTDNSLHADPVEQFEEWFRAAQQAGIPEPNAMTLATASAQGEPAARMLLLKQADARGFTFFTNYGSAKAADLDSNPRACLVFFWQALHRQVRVTGSVSRVPLEESAEYFASRPRGAQVGAWASRQSAVLQSRKELEEGVRLVETRFEGKEIPLPPHWGGYRLVPDRVEFWQGQPDRLHDRMVYIRQGAGWRRERLSP